MRVPQELAVERNGMERSDEVLVLACRRGDATAWEALVVRYQRLIYSIALRAGLSDDLAAEVFQRVFATLVAKLDTIEQPARISAWLVTTARREMWRVRQREGARLTVSLSADDDQDGEAADMSPLPEEIVVQLEEQLQIRTALAALDERCRNLLDMLYYRTEPLPYADIAATLGTSEGSIGPTRARCLQKLRRLLEEQEF